MRVSQDERQGDIHLGGIHAAQNNVIRDTYESKTKTIFEEVLAW